MKFDVVIPTKNRPEDLNRIIESINNSTILPQKVIIIDQSCNINKLIVSDKYEVQHIFAPKVSGLTEAKNLGITYCTSEIIHFFDDDIILEPNYFKVMLQHFIKHPEYIGICGRQKNSKSSQFKIFIFSIFHIGEFKDIRKRCNSGFIKKPIVETNILPGGITAYRSIIFNDYHFDEALVKYCLGEDMDFSYRVSRNHKLAFAIDALAIHNHSIIGRYDPEESFACKVAGYSYFYKKNMGEKIYDKLSYILVLLGIVVDALYFTLLNRDVSALKGLKKGFRYIKNNYVGVPFLDFNKIKI